MKGIMLHSRLMNDEEKFFSYLHSGRQLQGMEG